MVVVALAMRPPSQPLPFPVVLVALVVVAMVVASLLPGSGLGIALVLLIAGVVYAARGARRPKPPETPE